MDAHTTTTTWAQLTATRLAALDAARQVLAAAHSAEVAAGNWAAVAILEDDLHQLADMKRDRSR